jgi:hypothetical protein
MGKVWMFAWVLVAACGDNSTGGDDGTDTGSDPGLQTGGLEICGVEGPDGEPADCFLSGGGSFAADFNRDGVSDLAIGSPYTDVDGVVDAGAVFIFFNGAAGIPPQILTQNMVGSGDQAEPHDRFGWAVSAFDVSNRGKADLVVGVPYEDVGTLVDAGAISIFIGRDEDTLLHPAANVVGANIPSLVTQNTGEVGDVAEAGDLFGFALAWGELRTGLPAYQLDLAVGVPGEDINGAVDAGAVNVLFGVNNKLATTGVFLHQGLAGMNAMPEAGDNFGWAVAVSQPLPEPGQFNPTYLAIGVPGEDFGSIADCGMVHVLPPSPGGPDPAASQAWSQDSPGIAGGAEPGDRFGEVVVVRAIPPDLTPDLFVGVPREDLVAPDGTIAADAGMVHFIPSAGAGLTATGSRVFTQADSSGSPATETVETGDRFGAAIAGGRFRGSVHDIVIAAPTEDVGAAVNAGVIHYLKQSAATFPQADSRVIGIADTPGMSPASGDQFGFGLSAWAFGSGVLIVGAPGRGGTGAALVYRSHTSTGGLDPAALTDRTLTVGSAGATPRPKEQFGRVMY